jgi:hypothetical protein
MDGERFVYEVTSVTSALVTRVFEIQLMAAVEKANSLFSAFTVVCFSVSW